MGIERTLDYDLLAQQLIRAMRGDKSQEWLNKRLATNSNVIHRWEKGHSKASWEDFVSLCQVLKIDLQKQMLSYFRYQESLEDTVSILSHLFSNKKLNDIAETSGIKISKLRRLMSAQTSLSLNDFLQVIFSFDDMESMAFVFDISVNASIPLLDELNSKRLNITRLYFDNPNIGLLLICLELPGYRKLSFHQDSFLAKASGLSIKEINELIKQSEENDLITLQDGLYVAGSIRFSDRGTSKEMLGTRKFWLNRSIDNMQCKTNLDAYGSIVFNTSQKARKEIIGLYLRFFEDFKKAVAEDTENDKVPLVLNFNLFNPGDDDIND